MSRYLIVVLFFAISCKPPEKEVGFNIDKFIQLAE